MEEVEAEDDARHRRRRRAGRDVRGRDSRSRRAGHARPDAEALDHTPRPFRQTVTASFVGASRATAARKACGVLNGQRPRDRASSTRPRGRASRSRRSAAQIAAPSARGDDKRVDERERQKTDDGRRAPEGRRRTRRGPERETDRLLRVAPPTPRDRRAARRGRARALDVRRRRRHHDGGDARVGRKWRRLAARIGSPSSVEIARFENRPRTNAAGGTRTARQPGARPDRPAQLTKIMRRRRLQPL